jgi:uncharacterized protein (TIGR02246 family)
MAGEAQPLYTAGEVRERAESLPDLMTALRWAEDYLARPHPDLGRAGAVCPYVHGALDANSLWLGQVRGVEPTEAAIADRVGAYRPLFTALPPLARPPGVHKALVLTFPDLSAHQASELLGRVARRIKLEFVEDGLLPGPAYPGNPMPSAHSAFPSMAGPVPLVAIRRLFDTDLDFLNREADPPEIRARFVAAFLRHVGSEVSDARRVAAETALRTLTRPAITSPATAWRSPEETHASLTTAFNDRDLDAYVDSYEDDAAMIVPPQGGRATGKTAIRAGMAKIFELRPSLKMEVLQKHEANGLALIHSRWWLVGTVAGERVEMSGRGTLVSRQQPDGRWLVVLENTMTPE